MKVRIQIFLMVLSLFLLGVAVACQSQTSDDCPAETADPDGYLQAICEYIIANELDVSPGDPTKYEIRQIDTTELDGRPVIRVFLNCCFMGDIAIIDQETGEVVDFWLGDQ